MRLARAPLALARKPRATTTTALRTFKPAQVSAVRAYSGKPLSDKETAEENRYARARVRFCFILF